jgi:hypothetical protein
MFWPDHMGDQLPELSVHDEHQSKTPGRKKLSQCLAKQISEAALGFTQFATLPELHYMPEAPSLYRDRPSPELSSFLESPLAIKPVPYFTSGSAVH